LLLAKAGLLQGLGATTHHAAVDELRELAKESDIFPDHRIVDNGDIVLAAGISSGIDMALYVVARLLDQGVADRTAEYMEYRLPENLDDMVVRPGPG
jgi:transcriptional regulator GlxA family with amidase domain